MACRKCKYFIEEGDKEYFIVHQWETHGVGLELLRLKYPEADIDQLVKNHKETGKRSSHRFNA